MEATEAAGQGSEKKECIQHKSDQRLELAASPCGVCLLHQPLQGQTRQTLGEPNARHPLPIRAKPDLCKWARRERDHQAKWPLFPDYLEGKVRY